MKFRLTRNTTFDLEPAEDWDLVAAVVNELATRITPEMVASAMNYTALAYSIVEGHGRELTSDLLTNERFNTRLMRHINDATVGLVNEAVARITAEIDSRDKPAPDVDF